MSLSYNPQKRLHLALVSLKRDSAFYYLLLDKTRCDNVNEDIHQVGLPPFQLGINALNRRYRSVGLLFGKQQPLNNDLAEIGKKAFDAIWREYSPDNAYTWASLLIKPCPWSERKETTTNLLPCVMLGSSKFMVGASAGLGGIVREESLERYNRLSGCRQDTSWRRKVQDSGDQPDCLLGSW